MSKKVQPGQVSQHFNFRMLAILCACLVLVLPGLIGIKMLREQASAKRILAEAKTQLENGKAALAIGYLNRYLELKPDDHEALELKSKILFDTARDPFQAQEALKVHSQLIAASPTDPKWEAARRRMVRLNLMMGQWSSALEMAKKLQTDDAEAHRLYARASMGFGLATKNNDALKTALSEFEAAEAKEPGDVDSAEEIARIYRDRQEKPEKALQVLDGLVRNTANSPQKHAAALLARARHYAAVNDSKHVTADIDEAVRDDPSGLLPRMSAAEMSLQQHDIDAARHHLDAIPAAHRNDSKVKSLEGLVELAQSRPDEAIRAWRAGLLQIGGNDASLTWQLAHVLLELGRVSDAEPLLDQYRRLVGGDEPDPKYLYLTALAMFRSNRPADAVKRLEAIRFKVPKSLEPHVLYCLGQSYSAIREKDKAKDAFRQAAEISRNWGPPWKALAQLEAETSIDEAMATLKKGLTLVPNDIELLVARATALYREQMKKPSQQRSMSEIDNLLAQAARVSPGSTDVALLRAEILASNSRGEDSLALLKTASALSPKSPQLWLARANLLTNMNRPGEAQALLEEAANTAGPQAIFSITRAAILIRQGQINHAIKVLQEGVESVPKEQKSLVWKSLGDFYQSQKNFTSAAQAYRRWAELQPQSPEPRLAIVMTAMFANDEKAVAQGIEELRKVAGEKSYFWRLAKIDDLLHDRTPGPTAEQLDEAAGLIKEIETNDPQLPLGFLLEGRLAVKRKHPDQAIAAYRQALKLGAGQPALTALVTLLAHAKNDKEIEDLRKEYPALSTSIEQLATVEAIQSGNKERARALADQVMKGDPNGLDTRRWELDVLQALGDPKALEAATRKWISENPGELTAWLALLVIQHKAHDRAAQEATVLEIQKNVKTERPELILAQCYRFIGDLKRAGELFREAMARWPDDLGVLAAAVTFDEQIGQRDEAEQTLRKILQREPSNGWATQKLAISLASHTADRPAWEEAVALIGPEARTNDNVDNLIMRSVVYAQGPEPADRRKALDILEGILSDLPGRVDLQEQVARMWLANGNTERARDHAARAAEGAAAKPEAILLYASLLLNLNDIPGAETQLQRLIKIDPDGLPVVELKARLLDAQGKGNEGAKLLEKAFEERVESPQGLAIGDTMVKILTSLKQPEAAERIARRIAEIGPRGRRVLAEFLVSQGNLDDAAQQVELIAKGGDPGLASATALVLASRPGADIRWTELADKYRAEAEKGKADQPTFASLDRLALLFHLKQNYKDEIETYRKMIAIKPPNFLFLNNMAWTLCEGLNDPAGGLKVINQAIEKVGKQSNLLDTRGVIYTRLARYDEAVKDLELAVPTDRDGTVHFHLARVYSKLNKPDELKKHRDLALKGGLTRLKVQPSERSDWDAIMNP